MSPAAALALDPAALADPVAAAVDEIRTAQLLLCESLTAQMSADAREQFAASATRHLVHAENILTATRTAARPLVRSAGA